LLLLSENNEIEIRTIETLSEEYFDYPEFKPDEIDRHEK